MNKVLFFIFVAIFNGNLLFGQLPEKVSPEVYKVLLENDDVKVMEVTFKPGQSDKMHKHNPLTAYFLEGGTTKGTNLNGNSGKPTTHKEGKVMHIPREVTHQVKNVGDTTLRILLVEHKKLKKGKN